MRKNNERRCVGVVVDLSVSRRCVGQKRAKSSLSAAKKINFLPLTKNSQRRLSTCCTVGVEFPDSQEFVVLLQHRVEFQEFVVKK